MRDCFDDRTHPTLRKEIIMEPITGPVDPLWDAIIGHIFGIGLCIGVVVMIFLAFRARGGASAPPPSDEPEDD